MIQNEILIFFSDFIFKKLGIVYSKENFYQLEGRLNEVVKTLGKASVEKLYDSAKIGLSPLEERIILDIATNNETLFFRDQKVFDALKKVFIDVFKKKSLMRIWSAASSTGQEPYSIAMLLSELKNADQKFSIYATDISERVLEYAKSGIYDQIEIQRGLSIQQIMKYFDQISVDGRSDSKWRIKSDIRLCVDFKKLNLKDPFPLIGTFDIILCRNVLIYQSLENKKKIVERILEHLNPDGYLFLGGSESLIGITNNAEIVHFDGAIGYRKNSKEGHP